MKAAPPRLVCESYEEAKQAQVFVRTRGRMGAVFVGREVLYFPGRRIVPVGEVRHFLGELKEVVQTPLPGKTGGNSCSEREPAPMAMAQACQAGQGQKIAGTTGKAQPRLPRKRTRKVWVPKSPTMTTASSDCSGASDLELEVSARPLLRRDTGHSAVPLAPPDESSDSASDVARTTPRRRRQRSRTSQAQESHSGPTTREEQRRHRFDGSAYGQFAAAAERVDELRRELLQAEVELGTRADKANVPLPEESPAPPSTPVSPDAAETPSRNVETSQAAVPLYTLWPPAVFSDVRPEPEPSWSEPTVFKGCEQPVVDWFHYNRVKPVEVLTCADRTAPVGFQGAHFNSMFRPSRSPRLVVPYNLSDSQTAALLHLLGGTPQTWAMSPEATPHEHPVMALVRASLDSAVSGFYRGMSVLDVGGNPVRHLSAGHTQVHCCTPIVIAADAGRILKWRADAAARNYRLDERCECVPGVTWCQNRAGQCSAQAQALYCLDVIYYIGEGHWIYLMQRAEVGIVVYHRYSHQYNRYMADATVRADTDQLGRPWVSMTVPGNPVPYKHPYINLGEVGSMAVKTDITREGRPLVRTVLTAIGDVHVVAYYWGKLPMAVVPGQRGPTSNRDMRGMSTPAGVAIKDHADKLALTQVLVRWDGVDWYGRSADKVEDSLFSKFAGRVATFTSVKCLHDAVSEQYRVEMQRVNIPDDEVLALRRPTVWAATARLVQEALLSSGGCIKPSLAMGFARLLTALGAETLYPRAQFGECVEGSFILTYLPALPMSSRVAQSADRSWDLDFYLSQNYGTTQVFRPAAPAQKPGTRGAIAGADSLRGWIPPSSVCLTLICVTGGLWIICKSAGCASVLLRSSPSQSDPVLYRICASAMNGCLSGLAFLGISTLASRPTT